MCFKQALGAYVDQVVREDNLEEPATAVLASLEGALMDVRPWLGLRTAQRALMAACRTYVSDTENHLSEIRTTVDP